MKKILVLAVVLSFLGALAFAQDKPAPPKPPVTKEAPKAAEKSMKDDCCAGETVKEKSEGCGEGCSGCAGDAKTTGKAKSAPKTMKNKNTTAPKTK